MLPDVPRFKYNRVKEAARVARRRSNYFSNTAALTQTSLDAQIVDNGNQRRQIRGLEVENGRMRGIILAGRGPYHAFEHELDLRMQPIRTQLNRTKEQFNASKADVERLNTSWSRTKVELARSKDRVQELSLALNARRESNQQLKGRNTELAAQLAEERSRVCNHTGIRRTYMREAQENLDMEKENFNTRMEEREMEQGSKQSHVLRHHRAWSSSLLRI
jgi:hypothetical protein